MIHLELGRKIKTAMDETRLLILGSQVLFGFLFKASSRTASTRFPPPRNIWSAPRWL
jgi:hypothetical protein